MAATVAFGFAVVLIGLALTQAFRRYHKRAPAASRMLPARSLLSASVSALRQVKREVARDGWTRERAGQALAALRIAAAIALGRPVAQVREADDAVPQVHLVSGSCAQVPQMQPISWRICCSSGLAAGVTACVGSVTCSPCAESCARRKTAWQ